MEMNKIKFVAVVLVVLIGVMILCANTGIFGVDEATVDANFESTGCIYIEGESNYYSSITYTRGFTKYFYCGENGQTIMLNEKRQPIEREQSEVIEISDNQYLVDRHLFFNYAIQCSSFELVDCGYTDNLYKFSTFSVYFVNEMITRNCVVLSQEDFEISKRTPDTIGCKISKNLDTNNTNVLMTFNDSSESRDFMNNVNKTHISVVMK